MSPVQHRFARVLLAGALLLCLRGVVVAAPVSAARHRQAITANTAGLRFFRAGQLPRAALRFRDAIALDPDYVLAHYNLACVASRLRETSTAVAELKWLAASTDPVAKAKLDKALVDRDLDFVSALPTARAILLLAPYDPEEPLTWLAERDGVWSGELPMDDCVQRSYTFTLRSDGDLQLTVREACEGEAPRQHSFAGTLRVDSDGSVRVDVPSWPLWPAGVRLALAACPELEAPGSCFSLASEKSALGPFHRGLPGMSPMHAREDVATAR
jgi:hypothetical protein